MLDTALTAAWREVHEEWMALSSRVVCARLKTSKWEVGKATTNGKRVPIFVTVVCIYASTFKSSVEVKEKFFVDLQGTLDQVDEHDVLLVVGDFNARVGSSKRRCSDLTWNGVRGIHGVGKMNDAGAELLSFCLMNDLTMDTHYKKKAIHKCTW